MLKSGFKKVALVTLTLLSLGVLDAFANHTTSDHFADRRRPPVRPGDDIFRPRPPSPPPFNPPPFEPPHRHDYGCNDQYVNLYCKVDGHHMNVTAVTSCGYTPEYGYCNSADVSNSYYVRSMRVSWQCINGNMEWKLGGSGECKLDRW